MIVKNRKDICKVGKTATDRNLKDACVTIWTDGSVNSVQRKGGSEYIMIYKDDTKVKNSRPAGEFASSYRTVTYIKKVVILTNYREALRTVK